MNNFFKSVVLVSATNAIDLMSALKAADFVQPDWKDPLSYFEAADVVNAKHRINEAYLAALQNERDQDDDLATSLVAAQTAVT